MPREQESVVAHLFRFIIEPQSLYSAYHDLFVHTNGLVQEASKPHQSSKHACATYLDLRQELADRGLRHLRGAYRLNGDLVAFMRPFVNGACVLPHIGVSL